MLKEAIHHRPKDNYSYAYDKDTLHIQLRAKKGDLNEVTLIHGDPFEYYEDKPVLHHSEMRIIRHDEFFDYWFIAIEPIRYRTHYLFSLKDHHNEQVYFAEKGFLQEIPYDIPTAYFKFPFLNAVDVFQAPEWVKNTVWYQIFPERFNNGDEKLNPPGTLAWGSTEPEYDNFFGGDFEGVIQKLDYLKELGINGIYFTPIFKATTNHKYDTMDYFEIDPQFGDKETFKRLVKECHNRDIKVMLDAVFNHSGYYFEPFQDVVEHGQNSKYVEWFYINEFPLKTEPIPNYDTFAYEPKMPKLNTEHLELKRYLLDVARYWVEEFDIDGWRLDVANEVDHQFWREFRQEVKQVKEDVYILGEIWHDSMPWLRGDQFDAVMNYPFTEASLDFFARGNMNLGQFKNQINHVMASYPQNVNEVAFNLLGSHDTPRLLTRCNDDVQSAKQLMLFQLTFVGTPCVYYGDEIGMTGGQDPGCRKCMEWDESKQDLDLFHFVQNLIQLRKDEKSLHPASKFRFLTLEAQPRIVSYERSTEDESIIVVINPDDDEKVVELPYSHSDILISEGCQINEKRLTLGGKGFTIIKETF
ncbi:alpha-glycosidase [Halalkalibacillus sediminis]|uniref:Alpha-glycosidase n=1 Tax=Halalkalibacillus sediminis TaxID=2018042 RepID=A0A2I0QUY6_9BACI|nr:glycoside hydrolase family 13 protein [Halalkalibacillus sediminis]PKR77910.1 alpha-glycosidase [Halalkalibacillus sediminis]